LVYGIGLALIASLVSIRIGISMALVEIFLGFVAGNCGAYFGSAIFPVQRGGPEAGSRVGITVSQS
jgi:hypothetical protein